MKKTQWHLLRCYKCSAAPNERCFLSTEVPTNRITQPFACLLCSNQWCDYDKLSYPTQSVTSSSVIPGCSLYQWSSLLFLLSSDVSAYIFDRIPQHSIFVGKSSIIRFKISCATQIFSLPLSLLLLEELFHAWMLWVGSWLLEIRTNLPTAWSSIHLLKHPSWYLSTHARRCLWAES